MAAVSSAHAQYRCVEDGRPTFQDTPCRAAAAPERPTPATKPASSKPASKPRPPIGDPEYERQREAEIAARVKADTAAAGAQLREQVEAARRRCGDHGEGAPFVGATQEWVRNCSTWGNPTRVFRTDTAGGHLEAWDFGAGRTVFFDYAGRVTMIQR